MPNYHVSRQANYYDGGAYSVEIAAELDYIGPGALAGSIVEIGPDPRDAAREAIETAETWALELKQAGKLRAQLAMLHDAGLEYPCPSVPITLAMNSLIYATVADGMGANELRAWAEEAYAELPKCDHCGDLLGTETYSLCADPDAGKFCREYCAEESYAALYADADGGE